jgi:hypothetical protein
LGAQQFALAKRHTQNLSNQLDQRLDSLQQADSTTYATPPDSLNDQQIDQIWTDSLHTTFADIENLLAGGEYNYLRAGNLAQNRLPVLREVGLYFHNASKLYLTLTPYLSSNVEQRTQGLIEDYLQTALPYLERVADQQSEDTMIWRALYHAYSYLGMTPKADEAFPKANL